VESFKEKKGFREQVLFDEVRVLKNNILKKKKFFIPVEQQRRCPCGI
jgi:hypothetical protein